MDEDYIKIINKRFNHIGKPYSKPKTMAFMADGEIQELEEPDNIFTSMNCVWKLIMDDLPGKHYVLMNKQQAIRFIRVVKQRILQVLNNNIDFINIHLSKDERKAFNKKTNARFIYKLTNRIRDVTDKYNITDEDLYKDNPPILKKYIDSKMYEKPYEFNPLNSPSPEYHPNSPQYNISNFILTDIAEFRVEMDDIDEADKKLHEQDDTPEIIHKIARLKKEFLYLFTRDIHLILEPYYDKEVKLLQNELLQFYHERLKGIRRSAHFKYSLKWQENDGTRIFDVRREKEKERKIKHEERKIKQEQFNQLKPRVPPKPRSRKKIVALNVVGPPEFARPEFARPEFARPEFALPEFARPEFALPANAEKPRVPVPKPRSRKKNVTLNVVGPPANFEKPRVPPKPRSRKQKKNVSLVAPAFAAPAFVEPEFALPANAEKPRVPIPKPRSRKPRNTSYSNTLKAVVKARPKFNQPNTEL